jgi:hypothetical protein
MVEIFHGYVKEPDGTELRLASNSKSWDSLNVGPAPNIWGCRTRKMILSTEIGQKQVEKEPANVG